MKKVLNFIENIFGKSQQPSDICRMNTHEILKDTAKYFGVNILPFQYVTPDDIVNPLTESADWRHMRSLQQSIVGTTYRNITIKDGLQNICVLFNKNLDDSGWMVSIGKLDEQLGTDPETQIWGKSDQLYHCFTVDKWIKKLEFVSNEDWEDFKNQENFKLQVPTPGFVGSSISYFFYNLLINRH